MDVIGGGEVAQFIRIAVSTLAWCGTSVTAIRIAWRPFISSPNPDRSTCPGCILMGAACCRGATAGGVRIQHASCATAVVIHIEGLQIVRGRTVAPGFLFLLGHDAILDSESGFVGKRFRLGGAAGVPASAIDSIPKNLLRVGIALRLDEAGDDSHVHQVHAEVNLGRAFDGGIRWIGVIRT